MLTESPNPRTSRSAPALLLTRSGYRYSALELAFYPRTYSTAPRGMEENPMLCDLASREDQCGAAKGYGECRSFQHICRAKNFTSASPCDGCFWMEVQLELRSLMPERTQPGLCLCEGHRELAGCAECSAGWGGPDCETPVPPRVRTAMQSWLDAGADSALETLGAGYYQRVTSSGVLSVE